MSNDFLAGMAMLWISGLVLSIPIGIDTGRTLQTKITIGLLWPLVLFVLFFRGLGQIWREGI